MNEQLYVCENAKKCGNENECAFARQLPLKVHGCNGQESPWRDGCISGSKIVPVASQAVPSLYDALSTNSLPEAERVEPCECKNWCETDHRIAFLTNHHSRCPNGGNPLDAAFKLLKELTRGIECWASEEDGEVYVDCWKPYRKAKALEGVYLADDEKASTTERGTSDPDAVMAREYALIHQTRVWLLDEQYAVCELLLRLADKVEGKSCQN